MSMNVETVTLEGNVVRLEPLQLRHAEALSRAGQTPAIWTFMPYAPPQTRAAMEKWIEAALDAQEKGHELPFAIVKRDSGEIVGSTRFLDIRVHDRGLEIGGTWLTPAVQRSAVNTECKYLLVRHAFEVLNAIRVQLKTDSRNLKSQRAIERIGAVKEGVLRNHVIMPDGYRRHSVYYSILDTEWPEVKAQLEAKMLLVRPDLDQTTK